MATLDDLSFFQRPVGPMQPVGVDELGNPVYQNALTGAIMQLQMPELTPASDYISQVRAIEGGGTALNGDPSQRPGLGTQARNAVGALIAGAAQGITAPGRAARGEPVTYGDAWATALDYGALAAPQASPAGALRGGSFRAYHGSPHDFDRFSLDHIGTGEGAQSYGHGLYFADNEAVARSYRDALSQGRSGADYTGARILQMHGGDEAAALDYMSRNVDEAFAAGDIDAARRSMDIKNTIIDGRASRIAPDGRMYEVQINADPESFLDWDAPLSQQPEAVRGAIRQAQFYQPAHNRDVIERALAGAETQYDIDWGPTSGGTYVRESPHGTEKLLQQSGIPGIRYLDQGSRTAGTGTRNYVVFDDSIIDIIRKYGVAAAAPMLGMTAAEMRAEMDAQGISE